MIWTIYALIILIPASILTINLLSTQNSCFDKKQNGDETGSDCGGSCSLRCDGTYKDIKVNFSRVLPVSENRYDVFALMENFNNDVSFPKVPYNLNIYSSEGILLASAKGGFAINPQSRAIVYIPNLEIKQKPKIIDFNLEKHSALKIFAYENKNNLSVSTWQAQKGVGDTLQVIGELENKTTKAVSNSTTYALLYDETRTVYAVGRTQNSNVKGREKTVIAYTWGDLPKPTNVEFITVYDE
jgi:hypothetical protein